MSKWSTPQYQEILSYAYELKSAFTYKELCEKIQTKFGEKVDHEVLRKYLKRYQSVAVAQLKLQTAISEDQSNFRATVEAYAATVDEEANAAITGDPDPDFKELMQAAKEKARKERDEKLLKKLIKERAQTELIIDTLRDSIATLPFVDIKQPTPVGTERAEEEALLLFSDAQIGEEITLAETNGIGEYNFAIFQARFDYLTKEVRRIAKRQGVDGKIKKLHFGMLGDNVDGINIYRGQEHHLDLFVTDQVLLGCQEIAKGLIEMLDQFETIEITGIVGNHGRIGRKGENPSHINWDYLMYRFLEIMLGNYKERIIFNIPISNWVIVDIMGNKFLFLHGDTIKGWNGLPYYGIDRADSRLTKMLSAHGKYYKYMCLGHHHNPADIDSPGGEKILNGTMVGGSTFSINTLHTSSRPSQWFFGVNEKGITWRHKILLDE
ncbi:hypothetical protein [Paenibacillus sp. UNC496MF]|uniref:hypothetical protein n=1 Tax=Paenibacillus sp. UNC496MF TaxID=1502753 RepID=UPI001160AE77|nr:hypothetical protein [Paenibacillus sp. UNC496MF]